MRWLAAPITDAQAEEAGLRPFELEADELISRERTHRARLVVRAALLIAAILIGWAAWAEVEELRPTQSRPSRAARVTKEATVRPMPEWGSSSPASIWMP